MTDQRPEMAVIADLPADLRHALSKDFALVDEPLEVLTQSRSHATTALIGPMVSRRIG